MKNYLESLRKELKQNGLNDIDIQDIINDLSDMIQEALNEGLDEGDIAKKFGHPKDLAKDLAKDNVKNTEEKAKGQILYENSDIHTIDVKLLSEDVHIIQGDGDQFQVIGKNVDPKNYDIYAEDKALILRRKNNFSIKFRVFRTSNEVFTIKCPKNHDLSSLSLSIKSSDVWIKNIQTDHLKINSVSGDLDLQDIHGDNLQIKSISGDVYMKNHSWLTMTVSNVSGDFDIHTLEVDGDIRFNTVSGDVDIDDSKCKDVDYNSVSGDLDAKEFYPKAVSLKSVSGDITIKNSDQSHTIDIKSKRSLSGDINI